MQLAPATVSTLLAVLSVQGVNVTGDQLRAALAPLTGETPPPAPLELQPGEYFLVHDEEDRGTFNEYRTPDELRKALTSWYNDGDYRSRNYGNSFEDDVQVWVVRRQVNIDVQESVSLNFS